MSLELARVLLEHGADMEAWDDEDERTTLLLGLRDGYLVFVHTLLRHGADTEARYKYDESPYTTQNKTTSM